MSAINKETVKQVMLKLLATTPEQENDPKYLKEVCKDLLLIYRPLEAHYNEITVPNHIRDWANKNL